jgi:hypothetical protein
MHSPLACALQGKERRSLGPEFATPAEARARLMSDAAALGSKGRADRLGDGVRRGPVSLRRVVPYGVVLNTTMPTRTHRERIGTVGGATHARAYYPRVAINRCCRAPTLHHPPRHELHLISAFQHRSPSHTHTHTHTPDLWRAGSLTRVLSSRTYHAHECMRLR